jgi:uncharacterized protein (UPF0335 family)
VSAARLFLASGDTTPPQADRTGFGAPRPLRKAYLLPSGTVAPRRDGPPLAPTPIPREESPTSRRRRAPAEPDAARVGLDPDAALRLRAFVERIERLEEERKALAEDVKDIYGEAKDAGFDPKVLKDVVRIRRQDRAAVEETQALRDLYLAALRD